MSVRSKPLERPRYFPRQMITPDDLGGGVDYLRERMRRHNRALHGWGIASGLAVVPMPDADGTIRRLRVTPGLALTPQGDEIEVLADQVYDTSREPTASADAGGSDPWSSSITVSRRDSGVKFLAIRYNEVPSRPIRVAPSACDCGTGVGCENSRLQDFYVIQLLDTLPPTYEPTPQDSLSKTIHEVLAAGNETEKVAALVNNLFGPGLPVAAAAISDPWVVLADVAFENGLVLAIDPTVHRRMVFSVAGLSWRPVASIEIKSAVTAAATPVPADASRTAFKLDVVGTGLATVTDKSLRFFGDRGKIHIDPLVPPPADGQSLSLTASYPTESADAVKEVRLLITRPDGIAKFSDKITPPPLPAPTVPH